MRVPKTVPLQPPTSPMFAVTRRLPSFSGDPVHASLDERSHNAFQALAARSQVGGTAVLCEVVARLIGGEPRTSYATAVRAVAMVRGMTVSAVIREGLLSLYRDTFGREAEGRVLLRRVQQFEPVRRVYQNAYGAARDRGATKTEAREAAEKAAKEARRA